MSPEHRELREALGAYVLEALPPQERSEVEGHLAACRPCRDELAELKPLPGVLGRLSPEEAAGGSPAGTDSLERVLAQAARERTTLRRRLRGWQVAAALLLVLVGAGAAALVPGPGPAPEQVFAARPAADDASALSGTAAVHSRPWGMAVDIELRDLPPREGFAMWAVRDDDHRAMVASWAATEDDDVRLRGSCYVSADDVVRLELTDPDGEVLATFAQAPQTG